jgi:HSP20 family protein
VDVTDTEDAYEIAAELPGLEETEVEVRVGEDMLTIKGEKTEEVTEKEKTWHMTERRYGAFQRSFRLPAEVDADKVKAAFDKGVLKVTLPKAEAAKPKKIAIGK